MLGLIAKDFKLMFSSSGNAKSKIFSWIFTSFVGVLFIFVETFVFVTILNKIKNFKDASVPFFTLFLFIISVLLTIFCIFNAKKLFFDEKDVKFLSTFPISNGKKVASKLIFLFIIQYLTNLLFTMPLFIAYGVIFNKLLSYFYLAIFYPVLCFIFEGGVAMVVVYPYKLLSDFLNKHFIAKLITFILLFFMLAFLYGQVLNIFIVMVSNNQLDSIFNAKNVEMIKDLSEYLIPSTFLVDIFIYRSGRVFFSYLAISGGLFLLGLSILIYYYQNFVNIVIAEKVKTTGDHMKRMSQAKALIKKEMNVLIKDSNFIFSFTGLLVIQPFLSYLIISSMNTVFSTGSIAYFISVLKNFLPLLDILVMMLITLIISQGANQYITMEGKNIRVIKILPVNYKTQLLVKVLIPLILSSGFCLISYLVLLIGQVISFVTFIFGLLLTLMILVIVDLVALYEELKIKRNKPRSSLISSMYSYLLPLTFFGVGLLFGYLGVNTIFCYLFGFVIFALSSLPYIIHMDKKIKNLFDELEVSN